MKYINKNLILALLSLLIITGCSTDDSYDNKGYNVSGILQNLLIKPSVENETRTLEAKIAKPVATSISFKYAVDESLVNVFNEIYSEEAILLPKEHYEFDIDEAIIKAGMVESSSAIINFKDIKGLDREVAYVLPVSIISADIELLHSQKTTYFVFKGAALINVVADIEKNYLQPKWNNSAVLNNLSQMTAEALINARDFSNGEISTIMGIEGDFLIRIGDANFERNQIQIATSNGNFPDRDSSKGLPTKEWVHIAMTFDKGAVNVYVNGKLQSEGSVGKSSVNWGSSNFYVGYSYNAERYLSGYISECRIWNKVRTQEEIANSVYGVEPTSEGLVAYWKFDDDGGNIVKDHTENGNDLTAANDLVWKAVSLPEAQK